MKIKKLLFNTSVLLILPIISFSQNLNLTLRGQLKYPKESLSNICGYVDGAGNEYALVGTETGLSIVDVTNPAKPVEVKKIKGPKSIWREIKVRGDYAYVTTEGGGGLVIVNLKSLPLVSGVEFKSWTGDGDIAGDLTSIHALHIDKNFVYLYGSKLFGGAALACDITDPWNPKYMGKYKNSGPGKSSYVHDGYVRNDTLYACHIYEGFYSVVDFRDKKAPKLLATQYTPTKFTHNSWLSNNSKVLFTTDENSGSFLTSYDISDLDNIKELDRIQAIAGSKSIVHNTHVITVGEHQYAVTSWYRDGFTIVDISRPNNLVQVGWYDTYSKSGDGFNGAWGVYPYLPSGTIVVSNIEDGLDVYTPNYIPACYLEGTVTDSTTGKAISGATIEILNTTGKDNSKLTGTYSLGVPVASTGAKYTIRYSKSGYMSMTYLDLPFKPGDVLIKNVKLYSGANGIVNNDINATFNAYPNPFNDKIVIDYQLQNNIKSEAELIVTDVVGRKVKNIKINETEGKIILEDLTDTGIYFVTIVNKNGSTKPLKIVKLK